MSPTMKGFFNAEHIVNYCPQWPVADTWFEPQWWQQQDAVTGQATGRGTTYFVRYQQHHLVLRHYRRGGLIGKLIQDSFCFFGWRMTRAQQESILLVTLRERGLAVPEPIAVRIQRHGLFYRNDMLQRRIDHTRDLVAVLAEQPLPADIWQAVGEAIGKLHAAHCYHHDLNLRNLLLDEQQRVWIIDFDRCRLRRPGAWRQKNLERLQRSLHKELRLGTISHWQEQDWQALMLGYQRVCCC